MDLFMALLDQKMILKNQEIKIVKFLWGCKNTKTLKNILNLSIKEKE